MRQVIHVIRRITIPHCSPRHRRGKRSMTDGDCPTFDRDLGLGRPASTSADGGKSIRFLSDDRPPPSSPFNLFPLSVRKFSNQHRWPYPLVIKSSQGSCLEIEKISTRLAYAWKASLSLSLSLSLLSRGF